MLSRQESSVGIPEVLADLKRDLSELTQTTLKSNPSTSVLVSNTPSAELDLLRSSIKRLEDRQQAIETKVEELCERLSKIQYQPGQAALPISQRFQKNAEYQRSSSAAKIKSTMRAVGFLGPPVTHPIKPLRFNDILTQPPPRTIDTSPDFNKPNSEGNTVHRHVSHSAPPPATFQDRVSAIKALVLNNQCGQISGVDNNSVC